MLLCLAMRAGAQAPCAAGAPVPPRPPAITGADTNDAQEYLEYGEAQLMNAPEMAKAAGYWAMRLDPTSPDALLLSWRAQWRMNRRLLEKIMRGDEKAYRSPAAIAIDSLYWQAMIRDPFAAAGPAGVYGPFPEAARAELARNPGNVGLWMHEAARFYRAEQYDSAVAYVRSAITALDARSAKTNLPFYLSREIFHYAIGKALFAAGDRNAARAAFGAALTENLAFYQAHAALASIAWTNWSDLPDARREFELALELRDDAVVRYDYGTVLLEAGEPSEALAQFERAIVAEPYFARSWFNKALALDRLGRRAEAATAYLAFIERAPKQLKDAVQQARGRAAAIRASAATSAAERP